MKSRFHRKENQKINRKGQNLPLSGQNIDKMREKEYLYVGKYKDVDNNFIIKIGTTNDLERRRKEHNRNYRRAKTFTLPKDEEFEYLWHLKLSKYNTLRYEDNNRELWRNMAIGTFIRNDRFLLEELPEYLPVQIRKTYQVKII